MMHFQLDYHCYTYFNNTHQYWVFLAIWCTLFTNFQKKMWFSYFKLCKITPTGFFCSYLAPIFLYEKLGFEVFMKFWVKFWHYFFCFTAFGGPLWKQILQWIQMLIKSPPVQNCCTALSVWWKSESKPLCTMQIWKNHIRGHLTSRNLNKSITAQILPPDPKNKIH